MKNSIVLKGDSQCVAKAMRALRRYQSLVGAHVRSATVTTDPQFGVLMRVDYSYVPVVEVPVRLGISLVPIQEMAVV